MAAGKKVVNLTPHAVTIFHDDPKKYIDIKDCPHDIIEASGTVARCTERRVFVGNLQVGDNWIPISRVEYGAVQGAEATDPNTIYIVSMLVAQTAPHRHDLFYPGEQIRNQRGDIIGCIGLSQISTN